MAKSKTTTNKIIGIALSVLGVGLIYWGYDMSQGFGSQISQTFTGSYSNEEIACFIGGGASIFVGSFLFFKK